MKISKRMYLILGFSILFLLGISYFIKFNVESGFNYVIETRLLGALIFYNPFVLGLYILVSIYLIVKGSWSKNEKKRR